jgi:uncharacterized protein YkvS
MTTITGYYEKAIEVIRDYFVKEQCLALRIKKIENNSVILDLGISDGREFILTFDLPPLQEEAFIHIKSDNIYCDVKQLIKIAYINNPDILK